MIATETAPDPAGIVTRRWTQSVVRTVVAELPEAEREVVLLAYGRGLSQSEIADRMGSPIGTVKSRTRRAMARLRTRLAPSVLLDYLHAIEERHGRERRAAGGPRWQDRTLDLDLIVYGEVVSDGAALTLPHPRAAERDFVLAPWLQLDGDAVLPGRGRVADLLRALGEEESG